VTVIACEVSPVLHTFPLVALEVRTTDDPAQKVNGPLADIVGVVGVESETVTDIDVEEHPAAPEVTV
jgi:hypothetical protein